MATRQRNASHPTESASPTARDREMGREGETRGDLGQGRETWKPSAGEQGLSNRPDDEATSADRSPAPRDTEDEQDAVGILDDAYQEDEFEEDEFDENEDDEGEPAVEEEDTN